MENDILHEQAKVFANKALHSLGMYDPMTIARGDAEFIWDLAYDAYLYRALPTLPIVGGISGGASTVLDSIPGGKL